MNIEFLEQTARSLVSAERGILAADESTASANKRFAAVGIEETEENRRIYRQILLTTARARETLSGIIFFDETFWQVADDGRPFRDIVAEVGVLPGIKVDEGLVDLPGFPGEKISKGLDNLPERLERYRNHGARFAKWRSVIAIGENIPTKECIDANAFTLARYARLCQDYDIVPIVEPEVLFDGEHTAERCSEVTARVYGVLFRMMKAYRVHLPGAILKTGMVLPGKSSGIPIDASDVSERTVRVLHQYVPHELGGVVFLSGGQTPNDAFRNLNAIIRKGPHPWQVTFSYSRALQDPVLHYFAANRADRSGAQNIFASQLDVAVAARKGMLGEQNTGDSSVSASQDI